MASKSGFLNTLTGWLFKQLQEGGRSIGGVMKKWGDVSTIPESGDKVLAAQTGQLEARTGAQDYYQKRRAEAEEVGQKSKITDIIKGRLSNKMPAEITESEWQGRQKPALASQSPEQAATPPPIGDIMQRAGKGLARGAEYAGKGLLAGAKAVGKGLSSEAGITAMGASGVLLPIAAVMHTLKTGKQDKAFSKRLGEIENSADIVKLIKDEPKMAEKYATQISAIKTIFTEQEKAAGIEKATKEEKDFLSNLNTARDTKEIDAALKAAKDNTSISSKVLAAGYAYKESFNKLKMEENTGNAMGEMITALTGTTKDDVKKEGARIIAKYKKEGLQIDEKQILQTLNTYIDNLDKEKTEKQNNFIKAREGLATKINAILTSISSDKLNPATAKIEINGLLAAWDPNARVDFDTEAGGLFWLKDRLVGINIMKGGKKQDYYEWLAGLGQESGTGTKKTATADVILTDPEAYDLYKSDRINASTEQRVKADAYFIRKGFKKFW